MFFGAGAAYQRVEPFDLSIEFVSRNRAIHVRPPSSLRARAFRTRQSLLVLRSCCGQARQDQFSNPPMSMI
jgi:hypothetical protein